ncbi:hypothetical protein ABZ383_26400 [Streptomyces sp. NPDC005900]|uniref:hypothetical protein n=1 Tax=Streptomyces sp. NPDC005900 TaxID=3154569 RepID=UPI0033E87FE8
MKYTISEPDDLCQYPVTVPGGYVGYVFRWHKYWWAVEAGTGQETRHLKNGKDDPVPGREKAALYLATRAANGLITPTTTPPPIQAEHLAEPPLLHPRMKDTQANRDRAREVDESLALHLWTRRSGFPGTDNPMMLECADGWRGPLYWSHLRGRNGNPPSLFRHPDCEVRDQVRERDPRYGNA